MYLPVPNQHQSGTLYLIQRRHVPGFENLPGKIIFFSAVRHDPERRGQFFRTPANDEKRLKIFPSRSLIVSIGAGALLKNTAPLPKNGSK